MHRAVIVCSWALAAVFALGCEKRAEEVTPAEVVPAEGSPNTATSGAGSAEYVGTSVCAGCHESQHEKWVGSHHDLAMQHASEATVLGDFSDVVVRYYDEKARFLRDGDGYAVEARGSDGAIHRFPVVYAFGVEPLQQYLVEVAPGRLQAFPFAWDTRAKSEGGQRWFHRRVK